MTVPRRTAVALALACAVGMSAAGQDRRDWRDYGGGPDNSKFTTSMPSLLRL